MRENHDGHKYKQLSTSKCDPLVSGSACRLCYSTENTNAWTINKRYNTDVPFGCRENAVKILQNQFQINSLSFDLSGNKRGQISVESKSFNNLKRKTKIPVGKQSHSSLFWTKRKFFSQLELDSWKKNQPRCGFRMLWEVGSFSYQMTVLPFREAFRLLAAKDEERQPKGDDRIWVRHHLLWPLHRMACGETEGKGGLSQPILFPIQVRINWADKYHTIMLYNAFLFRKIFQL